MPFDGGGYEKLEPLIRSFVIVKTSVTFSIGMVYRLHHFTIDMLMCYQLGKVSRHSLGECFLLLNDFA